MVFHPHNVVKNYSGDTVSISPYDFDDGYLLSLEVEQAIKKAHQDGLNGLSIPQFILNSDQSFINQIKIKAFESMEKSDAIWIPGSGADIHPEFYGQMEQVQTDSSSSYYREILEFALIDAALTLNKPIIGICHGSQMVNVYLGGTLHQHVPNQFGITPELDILTHEGPLGSVIEGKTLGPSYHHQAVDKVADLLEIVATYDGIIKATQSKEGKPIILCQFHPEYEVDQNNKNILQQFINLSSDSAMKNKTLQLSDILHQDSDLFKNSSNDFSPAMAPEATQAANNPTTLPIIEVHHEPFG